MADWYYDRPFMDESKCLNCGDSMGKSTDLICSEICEQVYGMRSQMVEDFCE